MKTAISLLVTSKTDQNILIAFLIILSVSGYFAYSARQAATLSILRTQPVAVHVSNTNTNSQAIEIL